MSSTCFYRVNNSMVLWSYLSPYYTHTYSLSLLLVLLLLLLLLLQLDAYHLHSTLNAD